MNSKHMTGMVILGALVATPALANHESGYSNGYNGSYQDEQYEYAQVISSEPLVRQVHVTVPQRECYNETHYVPVNGGRYGSGYGGRYGRGNGYGNGVVQSTAGSMILGGLIGAAIGHQIGNQQSRRTGAIAGAIIGTAIGNEAAQRRGSYGSGYGSNNGDEYGQDELRAVDSQRCEVRNEQHVEERIDGYRVTYRYNNRTYTTQTVRDPGAQIRVRVSVSPLG
jgi:uncharacterized protein YcfJ